MVNQRTCKHDNCTDKRCDFGDTVRCIDCGAAGEYLVETLQNQRDILFQKLGFLLLYLTERDEHGGCIHDCPLLDTGKDILCAGWDLGDEEPTHEQCMASLENWIEIELFSAEKTIQ
ncbi:MAG: hypothetical protein BWY74_02748 [Firmicutes bacterium ADurb.Bin419]|nr:MAG: hypothetical protein BWY74_02748 [Firmicutes bacterium ADurb.Bin419]